MSDFIAQSAQAGRAASCSAFFCSAARRSCSWYSSCCARARLEEMLRTHGPGSRPASHGRHALVGQPAALVILERVKAAPFLLRGQWEKELETVFLDDLEFVRRPHSRLSW
ncbi:hypothetical protein ACFT0G_35330 [Streptomyces sp. NPDC057020]|uniref:hypothetical protein n=1 Tax=unclassified Streptomyces TaxID=2593676 RepID=UPI0036273B81